jgi:hypothetical protein
VGESDRPVSVKLWAAVSGLIGLVVGALISPLGSDAYEWGKERLFPTEPVSILLQLDPAKWEASNIFGGESYEWVFPGEPSLLRPPPRGACFRRYWWSKGPAGVPGIDAMTTRFRVTIQSGGDRSVLLESLSPVIHRRLSGEEGTHVACPVGGAVANVRRFAIDLDRKTGVFTDGEGNPLETTMLKFGSQDSEPILVIATARDARYDWSLRLNFIIDGEPVPAYLNDDGRLFSTTGIGRARTVHWDGKTWLPGEGPLVGRASP